MDWMSQLSGVLKQYSGAGAAPARSNVHDDFDQIAQTAPQSELADGLAAAFRSDQTPEFGKMAAQLFGNSNGQQRAGILNTLIRSAGPMILSQVLSRRTDSNSGGGLSGVIDMLTKGQQTQITPEQADQIPPEAVEEIAAQAEKRDPSVIDQVSNFYAEHPTLVKTLGAAALTIALSQIARRQTA
ncbi:MAG: hypothetical protein ABI923_09160 [bacterium]